MRSSSLRKLSQFLPIPLILGLLLGPLSCISGGGGGGPLGGSDLGAGPGGSGPGIVPSTPTNIASGPGAGGGSDGGGGSSTSGGSAVPPLDSGIVGPSTDVGTGSNPRMSTETVSFCSSEDKVKIHVVGRAYSGSPMTGGVQYYEDGRVLRVVDRLGKEYLETKIKTVNQSIGQALWRKKGVFDLTLILGHLPVEIVDHPLAFSTLRFYLAPEDYTSASLDEMQTCPPDGRCYETGWISLDQPYFDAKLIEAAKSFVSCHFGNIQRTPVHQIQMQD